jgi:hypothetical protein
MALPVLAVTVAAATTAGSFTAARLCSEQTLTCSSKRVSLGGTSSDHPFLRFDVTPVVAPAAASEEREKEAAAEGGA